MVVLQAFRNKEKRYPVRSSEDLETLQSLRDTILPDLGVDPNKLPNEVFRFVFIKLLV